jgi:hypothetical protein
MLKYIEIPFMQKVVFLNMPSLGQLSGLGTQVILQVKYYTHKTI